MANKCDFETILEKMCQLFAERLNEPVTTDMVGYETIQLASSEIDYPEAKACMLPDLVLCHMFICDDLSGYAIVNVEQTELFAMGTFYGLDYHEY